MSLPQPTPGRPPFYPGPPVRDPRKGIGVRKCGDRLVLDSAFYVLRSGCRWRMLPRDLMPWDAVHRWCTEWRRTAPGTAPTTSSAAGSGFLAIGQCSRS
ncbi:transposase [Kitasatospora sp. NPDC057500]|uniref:transposase n=1 Tax=Kitasatospora sp. NPDC057500 TaxID=3346151 RepID=UPI0036A27869